MMTTTSNPPSNRWVRYRSVAYLRGKGFSYGVKEMFPNRAQALGKYLLNFDTKSAPHTHACDEGFDVLAPNKFNYAFLGPRIFSNESRSDLIAQAAPKLKFGGHLMVLATAHETSTEAIHKQVARTGAWQLKDAYHRDNYNLHIYKKISGGRGIQPPRPRPAKRACIARYGALGDAMLVTPLIRALHDDGYSVTLNITEYALPIFENNPYVSNYIIQERDAIPNPELGEYWSEWTPEYDRYINLSESIEGTLLKLEGRRNFYTSNAQRRAECGGINYQDHTLALGGYPNRVGERPTVYLTEAERRNAKRLRDSICPNGERLVLWALNGSSHHKVYAFLQPLLDQFLTKHPDVRVITLGDERAKEMEFDHPQVTRGAARWNIREVIALTEVADCVVGPESAIVNFASAFPTPKIVLMSHSAPANLTRYWQNTISLEPEIERAPCYPCHQLHYSMDSCPIVQVISSTNETLAEGPVCAMGAISMPTLINALEMQLTL